MAKKLPPPPANDQRTHQPTSPWTGFAGRLRETRVEVGLTQAQLGVKAEVGSRLVPSYENGAVPSLRESRRIAETLGVDLGWLLFGVPPQDDIPPAIEQFIAANAKVTAEEAEQLRKVRWYHPHIEMTLGMVEDAWREIRDAQQPEPSKALRIRPGRKPLAR